MEANRKRRGFVKSKLIPFYNRSGKPSSTTTTTTTTYISSQANPSQASLPATSVGYLVNNGIPPSTKQKLSYVVPADTNNVKNSNFKSQFDRMFGDVGDEHVDAKAASYISAVQERFKLERVNSKHEMINSSHILQATN